MTANYELQLRVNAPEYSQETLWNVIFAQNLLGDIRPLARNFKWIKSRTCKGVDQISFTVNDKLFAQWLEERNATISSALRPQFLDCRVVRNGVPIVAGTLATLPAYQPLKSTADLTLTFDGYFNLLDGIYIYPTATQSGSLTTLIQNWLGVVNTRVENYTSISDGYGFKPGTIETLGQVDKTIDQYITVKSLIANACDNSEGAGAFEFYFHPDRTYDIIKDANFGTVRDYVIAYPASSLGVSAINITAPETDGYSTRMICVGAGETSANSTDNTAIIATSDADSTTNPWVYKESLLQLSSVSTQSVLQKHADAEIAERSRLQWQPNISLSGRQISPAPSGANGEPLIWIGDTVTVENSEDLTGWTSGTFRVQELAVSVSPAGSETITPTLERINE